MMRTLCRVPRKLVLGNVERRQVVYGRDELLPRDRHLFFFFFFMFCWLLFYLIMVEDNFVLHLFFLVNLYDS